MHPKLAVIVRFFSIELDLQMLSIHDKLRDGTGAKFERAVQPRGPHDVDGVRPVNLKNLAIRIRRPHRISMAVIE
jgi:hypothetical protein